MKRNWLNIFDWLLLLTGVSLRALDVMDASVFVRVPLADSEREHASKFYNEDKLGLESRVGSWKPTCQGSRDVAMSPETSSSNLVSSTILACRLSEDA